MTATSEVQTPTHERSPLKTVSALVGLAAAIFAAASAGNAVAGNEHEISRTRIAYFVHQRYFPNAVDRPEWTRRNLTTADFQSLPIGTAEAWKFWKRVEDVPDSSVVLGPTTEKKNIYDLDWTWDLKDGTSSPGRVEAGFSCADWFERYVPFMTCSRDNVRLDDSRRR